MPRMAFLVVFAINCTSAAGVGAESNFLYFVGTRKNKRQTSAVGASLKQMQGKLGRSGAGADN